MVISQVFREMVLTRETRLAASGAFHNRAIIFFVDAPSMHALVMPVFIRFAREGGRALGHGAAKFLTVGDNSPLERTG
jgi:hypothetical protein